ncbi:MAG: LPS export ABC transporter permease LptF [Alphaproteobacteria bacterium]|nr:LPS export ABC transporter permease LptF [Alphaproteobacteria bacterium]
MKIFDKYLFRHLAFSGLFIALTLAGIVFLTQSLQFLELVINSGASAASFIVLAFLGLPRFFEIILPLSMMAATLFIYNRMTMDSELVAVRAAGFSPLALAKPAILLACIVTAFLWVMTLWAAPKSLSSMIEMRRLIKTQISALLFHEGVFNQAGKGLTVYIRDRESNGELRGLMIYDGRAENKNPSVILARRGILDAASDGHQVIVYDGLRQEYDAQENKLQTLNFEQYTIDLPDNTPVRERYREPDERTLFELLSPDVNNKRDVGNMRDFTIELHRRLAAPLLALTFTLIACAGLLSGYQDRRGQGWRIALSVVLAALLQGLFIGAINLSRNTDWGLLCLYLLALAPVVTCLYLLRNFTETEEPAAEALS